MRKKPRFWGLHAEPSNGLRRWLGVLPFVLLVAIYLIGSHLRLSDNPDDKILPSLVQMASTLDRLAFSADPRTGDYVMFNDTIASLRRLLIGVGAAALVGLFLGLNMGLYRGARGVLLPMTTFISIVPPLAILPMLFIIFGVDELAKVMLIFIGTFPLITRDIYYYVAAIPHEQITKALTLGASQHQVVYRVVLPQVMPRLINTIRLSLGGGWLFLIAAEAIASTDGLGYRIFLVRRYLAMDVIIPYVLWVTFLGFSVDWLLQNFMRWRYRWYQG